MVVAPPAKRTWQTVVADAAGPARFVVDLEGAAGEWRQMLEQSGYLLLDAGSALHATVPGAVIARHLVSRAREPERTIADWHGLLERGGRLVLIETAARRGLLGRRPTLLFPPRQPYDRRAPYRAGLPPAEAALLLQAAGFVDTRCFALPVPPSVSFHYLVSARRR